MRNTERIIVLDGHDCCGKSTLSAHVARLVGGTVVKPFSDSLGDHIAWLWQRKDFAAADMLARASIERVLERNSGLLVFDRHWATMFTVLPENLWAGWGELPPTVICHADLAVVVERMKRRGEEVGDPGRHSYYLTRYQEVAARCARHLIIDTGALALGDCLDRIAEFTAVTLSEGAK